MSQQQLARIPEPSAISDGVEQTFDYSKSKDSSMIVPYLVALNLIDRICEPELRTQALELCSGPGNFSQLLVAVAGFKRNTGVDMSSRMIALAEQEVFQAGLVSQINFVCDDVTQLKLVPRLNPDLITFMNGAHHMAYLDDVKSVLSRASELVKPEGVIFLMDPVRPKTRQLADQYIKIYGRDYISKGLVHFHKDFHDSVYASWTPEEMKSVIPQGTKRTWIHVLPFGFPAFQFVIGLPEGRTDLWATKGFHSKEIERLVPKAYRFDYMALKYTVALGKKTKLA